MKIAQFEVAVSALQNTQSKLQSENNELNTQLSEAEHNNGTLSKNNTNLTSQLDEAKSELEMESTVSFRTSECAPAIAIINSNGVLIQIHLVNQVPIHQ